MILTRYKTGYGNGCGSGKINLTLTLSRSSVMGDEFDEAPTPTLLSAILSAINSNKTFYSLILITNNLSLSILLCYSLLYILYSISKRIYPLNKYWSEYVLFLPLNKSINLKSNWVKK